MTRAEYLGRTDAEWRDVKVRSRVVLANGNLLAPSGTVFVVERKFDGFWLRSDPCSCCGVSVRITRVPPSDVEECDG